MRKFDEGAKGIFYFPEIHENIFTGKPFKAIAENPQGYVNGDMVRVVYGIDDDENTIPNVDVFEAFSPLVNGKAVFYLPIPIKLFRNQVTPMGLIGQHIRISFKNKYSFDFNIRANSLIHRYLIISDQWDGTRRGESVPVTFYSEKGEGLFQSERLNMNAQILGGYTVRFRKKNIYSNLFENFFSTYISSMMGDALLSGTETLRVITRTDNVEHFACKITDFQNKMLLIWSQPDTYSNLSFWFDVSEVILEREKMGVETYEVEAIESTDTPDYIEKERGLFYPKKKIKLNSGKWKPHVIEMLKSIMQAPRVWLYNPFPKYKVEPEKEYADLLFYDIAGSVENLSTGTNSIKFRDLTKSPSSKWYGRFRNVHIGGNYRISFEMKVDYGGATAGRRNVNFMQARGMNYDNLKTFNARPSSSRPEGEWHTFSDVVYMNDSRLTKPVLFYESYNLDRESDIEIRNIKLEALDSGRKGVVSQVVKLENIIPASPFQSVKLGLGEWRIEEGGFITEVIEELKHYQGESFTCKLYLNKLDPSIQGYWHLYYRQYENQAWQTLRYMSTGSNVFSEEMALNKLYPIAPQFKIELLGGGAHEISDFFILGNVGGYEDAKIQESSLTIKKHEKNLSEIELTLEVDDFRKPDYLII